MLVLTRKCGQKLIINDNIEVCVLETKGETVKLGIVAPKNVRIFREEIYEEIKKSNVQSGQSAELKDINHVEQLVAEKKSDYYDKLKNILHIPLNKKTP